MTDLPPPPPSVGSTPPPPPPVDLVAPPGAVGYAPTPMNSVALDRVGKLATAITALLAVTGLLALLSIWASSSTQSDAQALLDGTIDDETFIERAAPFLLMTTVQGVATLATAVVTIIWMYRLAKNLRTLHRGGTWGPGWAIGGWFLPPLLFVIPTLALREIWKASDPDVPIGDEWRSRPASPLIWVWFVLYSIVPLALLFVQGAGGLAFDTSEREMAQRIIDDQATTIAGAAVTVAAAIVFAVIVRGLTARHRRLTGEAV